MLTGTSLRVNPFASNNANARRIRGLSAPPMRRALHSHRALRLNTARAARPEPCTHLAQVAMPTTVESIASPSCA
jgi:hypothetical protein